MQCRIHVLNGNPVLFFRALCYTFAIGTECRSYFKVCYFCIPVKDAGVRMVIMSLNRVTENKDSIENVLCMLFIVAQYTIYNIATVNTITLNTLCGITPFGVYIATMGSK